MGYGDGKTKLSTFIAEYFATIKDKRVLLLILTLKCNLSNRYLLMEDDPAAAVEQGKLPPIHPDYEEGDFHGMVEVQLQIFSRRPDLPLSNPI